MGLGVRSTPEGLAMVRDRIIDNLVVIGSMRKADEWESTAVPELRVHAALAAEAVIQRILQPH